MQFRKKPVVIDASQWFKHGDHPVVTELPANRRLEGCAYDDACGWVPTLEGGHVVTPGDWIITGIKGEHYPCKPDIFDETYECAPDPLPVELQHAAAQRGFEHEAACDRAPTGAQPAPAAPSEERFFMDHGLWHDRETGQHLYTQDQLDHALHAERAGVGMEWSRGAAGLEAGRGGPSAGLAAPAAQPADSAMTAEQIEALAHRKAWRYKHSSDPAHSDTYTFNRATLLEFARALVAKETPHAR